MKEPIICSEKKHPGGKLVKVCLVLNNCTVSSISLTGDFFAEPIEKFEDISRSLLNSRKPINEVLEYVIKLIEMSGIKLYGLTVGDIKEALESALGHVKKLCP